jgi:hypothetical protein
MLDTRGTQIRPHESRHLQRQFNPAAPANRARLDTRAPTRRDVPSETKVQDKDFPVEAVEKAGYYASFRGMKAYNGVATLTREKPEKIIYGLHEGADNEDFRIIQTIVNGVPIINCYIPQQPWHAPAPKGSRTADSRALAIRLRKING